MKITTIASEGPDADLVGTVRREQSEDYAALWTKVNRSVVIRNQFTVLTEWLCVQSNKIGLQGLVYTPERVKDFPVIGAVPGSQAWRQQNEQLLDELTTQLFEGA